MRTQMTALRFTMTLVVAAAAALWAPLAASAHGGGSATMGGTGMLVVADDGTLLVTRMGMSGMMDGGAATVSRDLVAIAPDGTERWRASFSEGWPTMPVTDGDLVVVVLVDDWFMGSGGTGDGGWGGMGGGPMGIAARDTAGADGTITVVGLDLATGAERWRTTLDGDMGAMAQFSPDGSRLYLSLREMGQMGGMGGGPMRQGDAAGSGTVMTTTVVALDRDGNVLWTYRLDGGTGGMGGMTAGRR